MVTIDQKIADYLNAWVVDGWPVGNLILCIIALVLCIMLVGLIGIEREKRGRSAGLRTHLLVGVSSCILMIVSIYGFPQIFQDHRDVARLAAQIITGVGFLGAGAIIHRSSGIKGLTTAGTIWSSMAIGIACGSFNFILAVLGTGLIFIVLTVFKKVEVKVSKKSPTIILNAAASEPVVTKIMEVNKKYNCSVYYLNTNVDEDSESETVEVIFQLRIRDDGIKVEDYISDLKKELPNASINLLSHV